MNYDLLRVEAEWILKECYEEAENDGLDIIDIVAIGIQHGFVQAGKGRFCQ